jgi:NAD(P)-dependent dehydrogenase (short-subunit alcohol dehydrogenase family)
MAQEWVRQLKTDGRHHGLNWNRNPLDAPEAAYLESPPEQQDEWPGHENAMTPAADHGEDSYVGAGKLQGLKALITGGDSGIGRAVAIAFAREGADVAISYFGEHEDASDTLQLIQDAGVQGMSIPSDLRSPDECKRIVDETVKLFGGINILVNNAGFHVENKRFRDISPEQVEDTFRINIMSYIWVAQAALRHMGPGDTIINTGSVVALRGHPSLIDYSVTKGAIHTFTKSLALDLAEDGIRVNCVAPGPVWTPLITSTREAGAVGHFGENTFWHRPAQPAEIAPSYVFLASADSRFYSGDVFAPTGLPTTTR